MNCDEPPLTREGDRVSGGGIELEKVSSSEGKRVSWLREQLRHSEPYPCQAAAETSKVTGEESPCVPSCHHEKDKKSIEQSEARFIPCSEAQNQTPTLTLPLGEGMTPQRNECLLNQTPTPNLPSRKTILNCFARQSPLERGRAAFTLAEVLITLGIIGIVAAMTMPTLLNKTQSKELETQFKKVYSELNQVAQMFKKDNEISVSEYAVSGTENTILLLLKYYKGAKMVDDTIFSSKDDDGNIKSAKYNIYTMNGTKILMGPCDDAGFYSENGGRIYSFVLDTVAQGEDGPVVCVDINGHKGPNKYGYDIHVFYFTTDGFAYPMGQPHKNSSSKYTVGDHNSNNFFVTGTNYCKSTSNVGNQAACAYYALQNTNPQGEGNYWQDFLGKNR